MFWGLPQVICNVTFIFWIYGALEKTLKELKATIMLNKSLEGSITKHKDESIVLKELNERMYEQLKEYFFIHYTYYKDCTNCALNMRKAQQLKKEFKEIEDRDAVRTEFQRMKEEIELLKDHRRQGNVALKTREEQLNAAEALR